MWDLVGNPEDRFSQNETQISSFLFIQGVQRGMVLVVKSFVFLKVPFSCFVVGICDLVHDVKAIHCIC